MLPRAEARWIQLASIGWNHIINDRTNLDITYGGTNYRHLLLLPCVLDTYNPSTWACPAYTNTYAQSTAPEIKNFRSFRYPAIRESEQTDQRRSIPRVTSL